MNKKELTAEQAEQVAEILSSVYQYKLGLHGPELLSLSQVLQVAANLTEKAATVHSHLSQTWHQVCWSAHLRSDYKSMERSAELLQVMLEPLGIYVHSPAEVKKGCPLPNFLLYESEQYRQAIAAAVIDEEAAYEEDAVVGPYSDPIDDLTTL